VGSSLQYTQAPIEVFDHDWATLATGAAIPRRLYDLSDNVGYIQIGTSHDTSEFACDSIRYWWNSYGKSRYRLADSILLLCDGGGSKGSRYYIFKQDLTYKPWSTSWALKFALLTIRPIPPSTIRRATPRRRRMSIAYFHHVSRVCQGVIFESVEMVQDLIATATTRTGLRVLTTILDKTYQTGRKVAKDFKTNMKIVFDEFLPQWNYTANPKLQVI
jgi:Rhodopirellula transposase DDE domain